MLFKKNSDLSSLSLTKQKPTLLAVVICILASCFYMYEFILQVSPAVMTNQLISDLKLNAITLGTMTAFYYYSYTPMQLPAGFLFDRFGPRRLLTIAILMCALGAFLFSSTTTIATASAGRFMMGMGSSFAFIGTLVLISRWFPSRYFAFLTGLVELMSCIGAIVGETPLTIAVDHWGWRHTILNLAVIGVILGLLIWLIVRDSPEVVSKGHKFQPTSKKGVLHSFHQVAENNQTWFIALYSFMVWAPITAFAALWGIPFLVIAYGISTKAASTACTMIWLAIGIGCPLLGWWSDTVNLRGVPLKFAASLGLIGLIPVIYIPHLPLLWLYICLFLFGLAASGQSLAFGVVKDNNHSSVAGTAMGINNMATVAGGALFQPLIGIFLHFSWNGSYYNGRPFYTLEDYRKAFIILPFCYLIAFLIGKFLIRETHCQQQSNVSL
ncbi:MFS transporter [Rickettsiella grylli]|uniref:MFS transporter n=1 Tax=Rickettsiella grylli TaxID=59196 RepID=UPI0008FCF98E|nr:MFS transporter [Rickettsiella grylli]OJA00726.1 MFS transporter [Rickettsiella grylli]